MKKLNLLQKSLWRKFKFFKQEVKNLFKNLSFDKLFDRILFLKIKFFL
jgi:hypothetical protein